MPIILANGEEVAIPDQPFQVIVHQEEINVQVPAFVEISAEDTLACIKALNGKQWQHMSTGQLFRLCWYKFFEHTESLALKTPTTVEALHASSTGMRHIAGLIILACEALFEGKNIFLKNPETFVHPKTERTLVGGILFMRALVHGGESIEAYYPRFDAPDAATSSAHALAAYKKKCTDRFRKEAEEIWAKIEKGSSST